MGEIKFRTRYTLTHPRFPIRKDFVSQFLVCAIVLNSAKETKQPFMVGLRLRRISAHLGIKKPSSTMCPNGHPLFRLTTDSCKHYVPLYTEYALAVYA